MAKKKLLILWASENKDTALNMLLMYSLSAQTNNWWDEIDIVSWGASNLLVCSDSDVSDEVRNLKSAGVNLYACQRCAEKYNLVHQLEGFGFEVKLMGETLTQRLQDHEWAVITI